MAPTITGSKNAVFPEFGQQKIFLSQLPFFNLVVGSQGDRRRHTLICIVRQVYFSANRTVMLRGEGEQVQEVAESIRGRK